MSEHSFQDELEERDDVVDTSTGEDQDDSPSEGEPWAKTSSGDSDEVTTD